MVRLKYLSILLLLPFFIFTNSCSNDNSITGYPDYSLEKPTDITEMNTPSSGDDDKLLTPVEIYINRLIGWIIERYYVNNRAMVTLNHCFNEIYYKDKEREDDHVQPPIMDINALYNFRDNYLLKTKKGEVYGAAYYLLSSYGIENNLVNKYYKEHYELLKSSYVIAHELQHGTNNDRILIENEYANKLISILKIYKDHPNHRDIDPVLDYLEIELNKYQNKPKYVIAEDFE